MARKKELAGPSLWGTQIPLVAHEPFVSQRRYLPMVEADALSEAALKLVPGFQYKPFPEVQEIITYVPGTFLARYNGYDILHINPASNIWAAQGLCEKHAVSLSGGLGSAIAAERVIRRFGRQNVILWFADVLKENRDLYRFLHDLMKRFGGTLYYFTDGRRPEDVWDQRKIVPNNRIAPCSYFLKVSPFRDFIQAMESLPIVYIGYKLGEDDRMCDTSVSYREAIPLVQVDYPLLWKPAEVRELVEVCEGELGIEAPLLYKLGYDYNNCFAGETRYITSQGVKSFNETVGKVVEVLSSNGAYIPAEIRSFGAQQLFALTVERYGQRKVIYTTSGHRWICYASKRANWRKDKLTCELVPGDRLVPMFAKSLKRIRPSAFGVAHGITFGDGTCNTNPNSFAHVVLCGEKNRELLRYFPLSPTINMPEIGIRVNDLPRYFKDFPPLDESRSYLYGWLAGYFAADGKVAKDGLCTISSARKEHLEFVRDVCVRLGIGTQPIRVEMRKGLGREKTALYALSLVRTTLDLEFFLLSGHRSRIEKVGTDDSKRRYQCWTVVSVESTDRVEEVYCAVVPGTHCFTLEDNILTGNCGGECCRAGITTWVRTGECFPQRFDHMDAWEIEARSQGDYRQKYTICAKQVNGKKAPLALSTIRVEYFPQAGQLYKREATARRNKAEKLRTLYCESE